MSLKSNLRKMEKAGEKFSQVEPDNKLEAKLLKAAERAKKEGIK